MERVKRLIISILGRFYSFPSRDITHKHTYERTRKNISNITPRRTILYIDTVVNNALAG